MNIRLPKGLPYLEWLFLTVISGLVFLPYLSRLGYLLDEWYFIYDGVVAGPNIFHSMFTIDRPARGYFFDAYYSLFGPWPFPYHLGAYVWRLAAGLCALHLFRIIWPGSRRFAFYAALLFMLYPGYTWWVSAIEYQPHIVSLALQVFSFVMTLEAIRTPKTPAKTGYALLAILSGWTYIALVEYAIGMEMFRFLCVCLLVSRKEANLPKLSKLFMSVRRWGWNVLIPLGFIIWRLFFFDNHRKATDISLQLGKLQSAPKDMLAMWVENFFQSLATTGFQAWYKPLLSYLTDASLDFTYVQNGILAVGISILLIIAARKLNDPIPAEGENFRRETAREAILLGSVSLVAGVLPIVLANRYINLSFYSYYGLPASLEASILLMGLISYFISRKRIFFAVISVIVVLAGVTHLFLARKTIAVENFLQNFWWQASWRIPDLRPDTTLVTLYPNSNIVDYGLGLDELANLIYFPEPQSQMPIHYPISALMPLDDEVELILTTDIKKTVKYRVHKKIINYGNILIVVQPTADSCVRVVGGKDVVFSDDDPQNIRRIASLSKIENIRLGVDGHIPPTYAFGTEPEHGWCYFYEKVDLAVQDLDWKSASLLADQALSLRLLPADQAEWFPFIQAYAMTGNKEKLELISMQTNGNISFESQVCAAFQKPESVPGPHLETVTLVERLFCN